MPRRCLRTLPLARNLQAARSFRCAAAAAAKHTAKRNFTYTQPSATSSNQKECITSTDNAYVKHCVKLRTSSSYRRECGRTMLCGLGVVQEQLRFASNTKVWRLAVVLLA